MLTGLGRILLITLSEEGTMVIIAADKQAALITNKVSVSVLIRQSDEEKCNFAYSSYEL